MMISMNASQMGSKAAQWGGELKELEIEALSGLYGQGLYDSTAAPACILIGHELPQGAALAKCSRRLVGSDMLVYEVFGDEVMGEELV
jgi:hypothetical protein